jgi:anti-anti-sigma regulatory factor
MTYQDDEGANRFVVLEGSPLGTPMAKAFSTVDDAEAFVITRIRATVSPKLKERFEKALADQVVSEDGVAAVSSVLAGNLAFARALAKAYAPKIVITARRYDDEDDARR